jgi:hypothetical protein
MDTMLDYFCPLLPFCNCSESDPDAQVFYLATINTSQYEVMQRVFCLAEIHWVHSHGSWKISLSVYDDH